MLWIQQLTDGRNWQGAFWRLTDVLTLRRFSPGLSRMESCSQLRFCLYLWFSNFAVRFWLDRLGVGSRNVVLVCLSRDITLLTKVHPVKAMVFPVVKYGSESWTIKKVECQRTDAFELWCSRRLLRVLWTARSNQFKLKEMNPEYSLEGLLLKLKLKLQYFDHQTWRVN